MKLFINVATFQKGVVLFDQDEIKDGIFWEEQGAESKWVLASIEKIRERNAVQFEKQIKEMVVVIGPGSFTGLRVAVSVVNTFAYVFADLKISTLTIGQVFSTFCKEQCVGNIFQVYASDIFLFTAGGEYQGRISPHAFLGGVQQGEHFVGQILEDTEVGVKEKGGDFKSIPTMEQWTYEDYQQMSEVAQIAEGTVLPFYGKGANITVPKKK